MAQDDDEDSIMELLGDAPPPSHTIEARSPSDDPSRPTIRVNARNFREAEDMTDFHLEQTPGAYVEVWIKGSATPFSGIPYNEYAFAYRTSWPEDRLAEIVADRTGKPYVKKRSKKV